MIKEFNCMLQKYKTSKIYTANLIKYINSKL